jgi:diaminohydroxyphosphoribosylaminopyrimidine deaminase/5-amino-6-(5-phosphoribosylamino)uracil reductase
MSVDTDARYMQMAIALAARGLYTTDPNPRVGCLLVRDGAVVGEGWHQWTGQAHAEVYALAAAGAKARGATAYVTLEPCAHVGRTPPCADALIAAGVARVVIANDDPNPQVDGRGIDKLRKAGIGVNTGVLADAARELNPGFFSRMTRHRPYLRVKLAQSADGRIGLPDGRSRWITGAAARADVHRWRARSSAILTGIGTVLDDDPRLTARIEPPPAMREIVRVVVDRHARLPPSAALLREPGRIVHAVRADAPVVEPVAQRVERLALAATHDGEQLARLMFALGQMGINEIWTEAGARLSGALIASGLVDEIVLYIAPRLLGDKSIAALGLAAPADLDDSPWRWHSIECIGDDLRAVLRPQRS